MTDTHIGRGVARALLRSLAGTATERGCVRMEWWALDWNMDARQLYERIGAEAHPECITYHLGGEALDELSAASHEL